MAMTDARMKELANRLRAIGKSLARLTAEQLAILAEIARSDAEQGREYDFEYRETSFERDRYGETSFGVTGSRRRSPQR
jgi:hypothetical protein